MYKIIRLNNSYLIFSPFKEGETTSLGFFFKVGSRFEEKTKRGIAHFLEHMVFKGSRNYTYKEIKREIEGRGGLLNAFTSHEATGFYAHFLSKNLKITTSILIDMIFFPLLEESEILKEKNVVLEEIKMYNDLPSSRVNIILDKILFKEHPLGEEIIGYENTVKNLNRQDLLSFKNLYYRTPYMVISCSGNILLDELLKILKKKIPKDNYFKKIYFSPPKKIKGLNIVLENKLLEQSHISLGFRSFSYRNKSRFILDLINIILGANMSSRLFEELREKRGLCYEISTDVRRYYDGGSFIIHFALLAEKVISSLKFVFKEIIKLKKELISKKELERAKDYFLGQLIMNLERPQGRMFYLVDNFLSLGRIYDLPSIKKEVGKIDVYAIKKVANQIFDLNNFCIACLGDFKESLKEEIKKIINFYN